MQMMAAGEDLLYECLRCAHQWPERRVSHVAHNHAAVAGEHAHLAVEAICSANDLERLLATTLEGARRLTGADGVTLIWQAGDRCWYIDDDANESAHRERRSCAVEGHADWLTRRETPAIIADVVVDPVARGESWLNPSARSAVIVAVRTVDPSGALVAWWRTARTLPSTHVQMLELIAEAARLGISRHQLCTRIRESINRA
jgi:hypothetical protein